MKVDISGRAKREGMWYGVFAVVFALVGALHLVADPMGMAVISVCLLVFSYYFDQIARNPSATSSVEKFLTRVFLEEPETCFQCGLVISAESHGANFQCAACGYHGFVHKSCQASRLPMPKAAGVVIVATSLVAIRCLKCGSFSTPVA